VQTSRATRVTSEGVNTHSVIDIRLTRCAEPQRTQLERTAVDSEATLIVGQRVALRDGAIARVIRFVGTRDSSINDVERAASRRPNRRRRRNVMRLLPT